jgi:hypothetical protein
MVALRQQSSMEVSAMPGVMVFATLAEALRAGFEPIEFTPSGCFVRGRTPAGWALAIVKPLH